MAKMKTKKEIHILTEELIKKDINYRLCYVCNNSRDIGHKAICTLRETRSLRCSYEPDTYYYNSINIMLKKRYAKEYFKELCKESMLNKAGVLIDRGLRTEEINKIIEDIIGEI